MGWASGKPIILNIITDVWNYNLWSNVCASPQGTWKALLIVFIANGVFAWISQTKPMLSV